MAGIALPGVRAQLALVARLRWQQFRNSLRTLRGKFELASFVLLGIWISLVALGGGVGIGVGAYLMLDSGHAEWLAALFWGVFLVWQLVPLMVVASSAHFEFANLLRLPLRFPSFFLLSVAYGLFEPAAVICLFWLACFGIGVVVALPKLLGPTLLILPVFAGLNLLLSRMIFAWLERWLARRRTREILGALLLLLILGVQLIGPLSERWGARSLPSMRQLAPAEQLLPPGLAGMALTDAVRGSDATPAAAAALLAVYCLAIAWLLGLRLRAQFRGESSGEAAAPAAPAAPAAVRAGWELGKVSPPVAAAFEKELRYLRRNGIMLYNLAAPIIFLLFFSLSWDRPSQHAAFFGRVPGLIFPPGVAFSLLALTNWVYNSFGYDGAGIQLLLAAPVQFRDVMLGKNLAQAAVVGAESAVLWAGTCSLFGPPDGEMVLLTLAALVFVLPVNLSAGNLFSLYLPRRFEFGAFRRQRLSAVTMLSGMVLQFIVVGLVSAIYALTRLLGHPGLAAGIYLALGIAATAGYSALLDRCSRIALERRESLVAELCRP